MKRSVNAGVGHLLTVTNVCFAAVQPRHTESFDMAAKKTLLVFALLLSAAHVDASDRVKLPFFSLVPPAGWHTESDKVHRLLSSKSNAEEPPFLIVESCSPGGREDCPTKCDFPTIAQSGSLADLHLTLRTSKKHDDYVEYAASQEQAVGDGYSASAVRLLCGREGFVFVALVARESDHNSIAELDAVMNSIEWAK